MIKFFRRIRQQLLSQNRFSKYLLYAVGEIVLVMIGILLALQVNNWNEVRKQKEKEQSYLLELKSSLEKDSIKIKDILEFNENKLKIVRDLMTVFSDTLTNKQRVEIFFKNANDFTYYNVFEPSKTAFNNMTSAETINLISDKNLRNRLSNYYEFDYTGGVQERIMIINRKVVDNYFPLFFTQEIAERMFNLKTELISNEELTIHKNQFLLSELYGIIEIIKAQNRTLTLSQEEIRLLIKSINNNLKV